MRLVMLVIVILTLGVAAAMTYQYVGNPLPIGTPLIEHEDSNEPVCKKCGSGDHVDSFYYDDVKWGFGEDAGCIPIGIHGGALKDDSPAWYCTECKRSWGHYKTIKSQKGKP